MSTVYNITVWKGTTFSTVITWNGVDLTGYSARMSFRQPGATLHTISSANGEITLGGNGQIAITMSPSYTNALPEGSYEWDILLTSPLGEVIPPLVYGILTVKKGITEWA